MSFSCIICSDILNPTIDIYATTCGHIFHHICLVQWLERSKSCPQCRFKVTEKNIIRLYVTSQNTSGIFEDVGSLQLKLDNALFQIKLREVDIQKKDEKYVSEKKRNDLLRGEVQQLESEKVTLESVIRGLKDQIQYFKSKTKELDKFREENKSISTRIKELEHIELIISGSKDQVCDLLKYNRDPKSLSLMVTTLKKELVESNRKHKHDVMTMKLAHNGSKKTNLGLQSENLDLKRNILELEKDNLNLKKQLEQLKKNEHVERSTVLVNLKPTSLESTTVFNRTTDSDCIILNSPQPSTSSAATSSASTISLDERFTPAIKSSSVGLSCLLSPKFTQPSAPIKKSKGPLVFPKTKAANSDYHYDGLGGHSKDVRFPEPQLLPQSPGFSGFKRHQPILRCNSKHKVRKLTNKNLTDYLSKSSTDEGDQI